MVSMTFCIAVNVFGPTEQPKSAIHIVEVADAGAVEVVDIRNFLASNLSVIAEQIRPCATLDAAFWKLEFLV